MRPRLKSPLSSGFIFASVWFIHLTGCAGEPDFSYATKVDCDHKSGSGILIEVDVPILSEDTSLTLGSVPLVEAKIGSKSIPIPAFRIVGLSDKKKLGSFFTISYSGLHDQSGNYQVKVKAPGETDRVIDDMVASKPSCNPPTDHSRASISYERKVETAQDNLYPLNDGSLFVFDPELNTGRQIISDTGFPGKPTGERFLAPNGSLDLFDWRKGKKGSERILKFRNVKFMTRGTNNPNEWLTARDSDTYEVDKKYLIGAYESPKFIIGIPVLE